MKELKENPEMDTKPAFVPLYAWRVTGQCEFRGLPRECMSKRIVVVTEGYGFDALQREMESMGVGSYNVEQVECLGPIANTEFYHRQAADCQSSSPDECVLASALREAMDKALAATTERMMADGNDAD